MEQATSWGGEPSISCNKQAQLTFLFARDTKKRDILEREVGRGNFPACSQTREFSKGQAKNSAPKYLQQEAFDLNNPNHI